MAIPAGHGGSGSFLFVGLTMAAHALTVIGCFKVNRGAFRVAGRTSGASVFFHFIFIQHVFPILVVVMAVPAFKGFHVVFMGEINSRAVFASIGGCIVNEDFAFLGIQACSAGQNDTKGDTE